MNTLMIDYDLITPGQKYEKLIEYIKSYSAWASALRSTWLIRTTKSHVQVRDEILRIIDTNDKLIVTDVTSAPMAWYGLSPEVSDWIQQGYRSYL